MVKYCTRKAKGPFLLLTRDLSEPFDRENWEYFINLHSEGIICLFSKGKIPSVTLGGAEGLGAPRQGLAVTWAVSQTLGL